VDDLEEDDDVRAPGCAWDELAAGGAGFGGSTAGDLLCIERCEFEGACMLVMVF